jgi:3-oxoacyl-[acyl-carrier protein] reductase
MDLKDKIVIVTGGSSGIGLATAAELRKKEAVVIITGRNEDRLKKTAEEYGLIPFVCDVSHESHVSNLYDFIKKEYGRLDALINNAGFGTRGFIDEIKLEDFNRVFATNVAGAMLMAREAAKLFKAQNSGAIVNIASTAGIKGYEGGTVYAASKFALRGMTECWRAELRKYNVRVILVNPSEVQTEFAQNAGFGERAFNPKKLVSEDIAYSIISALEMNDRGFITELTVFATNPF